MLTSSLGIVLCRVGAVLLFVQGAKGLQYALPALFEYGKFDVSLIIIAFSTLIPAIAGIGLWVFAERICSARFRSADIEIKSSLEALDLVAIGTLLMGLYAAFTGIITALTTESMIWSQAQTFRGMPDESGRFSSLHLSHRVSYVSQIILGIALVLGRQRLARLMLRARYAGTGYGGEATRSRSKQD